MSDRLPTTSRRSIPRRRCSPSRPSSCSTTSPGCGSNASSVGRPTTWSASQLPSAPHPRAPARRPPPNGRRWLRCDQLHETEDLRVGGAVLLRPGVDFELTPTQVEISGGRLLLDRGAVAHDPWQPQGVTGRTPARKGDPPSGGDRSCCCSDSNRMLDLAETARGMANGLLRARRRGQVGGSCRAGRLLPHEPLPTDGRVRSRCSHRMWSCASIPPRSAWLPAGAARPDRRSSSS